MFLKEIVSLVANITFVCITKGRNGVLIAEGQQYVYIIKLSRSVRNVKVVLYVNMETIEGIALIVMEMDYVHIK
jgi:hypothetical protein